jgi:hypothetical protein
MTKPKAPCGHDGEAVIGAYVRCAQGCTKDPFTQPRAKVRKRGLAGHVDYCACKPCIVRRRAVKVVFRTKSGKTQETPWDGISSTITWTSTVRDRLRHWKLVDDDGDVLADGMCDVDIEPGDPIRVDVVDLVPPTKLAIHRVPKHPWHDEFAKAYGAWVDFANKKICPGVTVPPRHGKTEWVENLRQAAKKSNFGPYNSYFQSSAADIRQRSMPENFHPLYGYEGYRGSTYNDFKLAALEVEGVAAVEVLSLVHGEVQVVITETAGLMDERAEYKLLNEMHHHLNRTVVPAHVRLTTHLRTPHHQIQEALSTVRRLSMERWLTEDGVRQQLHKHLNGKARDLHVEVLPTVVPGTEELKGNYGFDVLVRYRHNPTGEHHYLRQRIWY